jgi:hypothetical protein
VADVAAYDVPMHLFGAVSQVATVLGPSGIFKPNGRCRFVGVRRTIAENEQNKLNDHDFSHILVEGCYPHFMRDITALEKGVTQRTGGSDQTQS